MIKTLPTKARPFRFGMRVRVTEPTSFFYGLVGTMIGEALDSPDYQLALDVCPEANAWVAGSMLEILAETDPDYEHQDLEITVDIGDVD